YRMWIVDIPIFVLTSVSVGLFYLSSQMGAYRTTWWKRAIYLPGALALGIGMAINNSRAVIEALLKMDSPFVRTPKYGIEKKGQGWKRAKYKSLKSIGLAIEFLLAIYFTLVVIFGILEKNWLGVPFYLLFMMGFWYVVVG